jgi:hypothetical protein
MNNARGIKFKQRRVHERTEVGNEGVFGVCSLGGEEEYLFSELIRAEAMSFSSAHL